MQLYTNKFIKENYSVCECFVETQFYHIKNRKQVDTMEKRDPRNIENQIHINRGEVHIKIW